MVLGLSISLKAMLGGALLLAAVGCNISSKGKNRTPNSGGERPTESGVGPNHSGGVIDGNGGEFISHEHNPWFVGETAVSYCIARSEDFSLSGIEAASQIAKAFATWKALLDDHKFNGIYRSFESGRNEPPRRRLVREFKEVSCDLAPPLVFKLGTDDSDVAAALRYAAEKTVGFALRTHYDDETGLAKGYIWIAPDRGPRVYQGPKISEEFWSRPHLFENVIAHEIGHVFGFQHLGGSIMDWRLPARAVEHGFDVPWKGEEFTVSHTNFDRSFCGSIIYADPIALEDIWKIPNQSEATVCLKWRSDLQNENEADTPVSMTIKKGEQVLGEHIIRMQEGQSQEGWLSGLFVESNSEGQKSFERTWFGSFVTAAMYRGSVDIGGKLFPVEIEIPAGSPGVFVVRSHTNGFWRILSIVPEAYVERLKRQSVILDED